MLEVRPSKSKPDRGMIRVRTTTFNQNDEPVMIFTGNLLVPRRRPHILMDRSLQCVFSWSAPARSAAISAAVAARRGPRRDVPGARAPRRATGENRPRHPQPVAATSTCQSPPTVTADASLREPFDLILLSCKAYDLASAVDSFAPAVGPNTAILPLLNGMAHIDCLAARFGAARRARRPMPDLDDARCRRPHPSSQRHASAVLRRTGRHQIRRALRRSPRRCPAPRFEVHLSNAILQEMWEKWAFIATGAGITCLMRASFGDIVAAGAVDLTTDAL